VIFEVAKSRSSKLFESAKKLSLMYNQKKISKFHFLNQFPILLEYDCVGFPEILSERAFKAAPA
jgi:hypothetical protein